MLYKLFGIVWMIILAIYLSYHLGLKKILEQNNVLEDAVLAFVVAMMFIQFLLASTIAFHSLVF